ncbi:MAG: hypothetical protein KG003_15680 [Bacteroidetes bacterium]|nr:hypothetical protein [Bacteroidota bacterium]
MNIELLIKKVENSLLQLGINPDDAKNEAAGQWFLMNQDMPIYIDAWEEQESTPWNYFKFREDPTVFQITVPFCYGPTLKRDEFLEELLVVNLNLHYGKFSYNTKENVVALLYRKPGSAYREEEMKDIVDALGYYAEMTYHVLKDEFNLKRVLVSES